MNAGLRELYERVALETRGTYPEQAENLVFGEGPEHPKLMLIGEAPGAQETLLKRPFVGKAGKNLDDFLAVAGLERGEIFISNTVKFRPTKIGKTGRIGNRPPSSSEIQFFRPFLLEEIRLISPCIVATLGNVPLQACMGEKKTVGEYHGTWCRTENGYPLFPLYHPAAVIYNRSLAEVYQEDVKRLAEEMRQGKFSEW